MSQLKDSIVTGNLRVTDTVLTDTLQTDTIKARSSSSSITITTGTDGQVLKTNGTNVYWDADNNTTYESKTAANGGTDVSLVTTGEKYTWNNKTSNTGTVTSVTLNATSPISIDSSAAITTSGSRTISHANSGVTAGTYKSVTVDAKGHVTGGSNPTTLSGYGITDAESTSNKVTSISSSSTDTEYPSAKCLYDSISALTPTKQYVSYTSSWKSSSNYTYHWLMSVVPTNWEDIVRITYRLNCSIDSVDSSTTESIVTLQFTKNVCRAYYVQNAVTNTDRKSFYVHLVRALTATGNTNGCGHLIGVQIPNTASQSYNATTSFRKYYIEVLDTYNCTVTLFETDKKALGSEIAGYTSTNYVDAITIASTTGLQETSDANTTYSALADADLKAGTATTGRLITAKVLGDNYKINGNTITIASNSLTVQPELTFDSEPTSSSNNPVTSSGVYNAIPRNIATLNQDGEHRTVTDTDKTNWNSKQSALISGSNIKTINNTSILGSGNISIPSGKSAYDLWLDAGNSGTEADFLASLQGPSGYSGAANELQVINDLTTGGTTDALSAEMGKVLSDCIGAPDLIDTTNMTTYTGRIASATGLWDTGTNRKFILIPVDYYYKILVQATSTNSVGLAWLKSYSGVVVGESPDFADNTTIWLQPVSAEITYEVPRDAHYLYIYVGSVYPEKVLGIRYNNQYSPSQVNLNLISYSKTTGSYIDATSSLWSTTQSTWGHILVPNNNYKSIQVVSDSTNPSRIAFLTQNDAKTAGSTPSYAGSTSLYKASAGGDTNTYLVPDGTKWIYIYSGIDGNYLPSSVICYKNTSGDVASIVNTNSENDFEIVDSNKNPLLILNNGHIKTLNFDSSKVVPTIDYSRRNFFTYNVNCNNFLTTNFSSTSINYYDPITLYEDNAILYLPATYTHQGPKTKLIVYCKEGSTYMTSDHDSILTNPEATRYFLHLGYAILAADGVPDGWKTALGLTERAVGNYVAVQSTLRAFEYVKNNFNIDCDNVFIFGYSQGGMYAENVIDNTNIPVTAAVLLSPALSMRYHQWDAALSVTVNNVSFSKGARLNIARMFNFPEVSNDTQLLALEYNPDKVCGYDPWTRNVENPYTGFVQGTTYGASLWGLPSGTSLNDITMKKFTKCPTKIWVSENDATLGVDISKVFVKAIKNSGQVADLQLYNTGNHHPHDSQTAITTFTENGENVSLLPMYMDMAAWYYNFGGLALQ